jgi:Pyridoxamine 5'-phosphate oxidase
MGRDASPARDGRTVLAFDGPSRRSPHVTPLVAVWFEDAIYFTAGPSEQKAVNLRANPNVILTTGRNEWERGLDVVVEGEAVQVTNHDLLDVSPDAGTTASATAPSSTKAVARPWCSR